VRVLGCGLDLVARGFFLCEGGGGGHFGWGDCEGKGGWKRYVGW
jgi:hypothetical protein